MCTVSWLPAADGYTLCFNRDERLTRAPGLPPALRERDGMPFLSPLDGDHGGTWLAVNAAGLTLALLNRYRAPAAPPPTLPRSRGLLVLDLIGHGSALAALRLLEATDLTATAPFTLVSVEPERPPRLTEWDGATLTMATHHAPGLLHTSSAVDEPEVAAARRAAFCCAPPRSPAELAAHHRSHRPERGRRSVCMHREDAETQCYSQVTVSRDQVTLLHIPDAPCRGQPLPLLALERRTAPCPIPG